jgi:hypothetical protein
MSMPTKFLPVSAVLAIAPLLAAASCGGATRVSPADGGGTGRTAVSSSDGSGATSSSSGGIPEAGEDSSTHFGFEGDAMTEATTIPLLSGSDWPWFPGGLGGVDGGSLGSAGPVCVTADIPSNCPAGAVIYEPGATDVTGWSASYPGAFWIWRGDVTPDAIGDLQFALFQRTFALGSSPTGSIQIAADDFAVVLVNGTLAGSTGSVTDESVAWQSQNNLTSIDLTPYLVDGENTITIVAQNGPPTFTGGACSPCPYSNNTAGVVFGGILASEQQVYVSH